MSAFGYRKLIRRVLCFLGLHYYKRQWLSGIDKGLYKKCMWCPAKKEVEE